MEKPAKKEQGLRPYRCITYTHAQVKTLEEALPEIKGQQRYNDRFAEKLGCEVAGRFGGAYNGMAHDEDEELLRMARFCADKKNQPLILVVQELEVFSTPVTRANPHAIRAVLDNVTIIENNAWRKRKAFHKLLDEEIERYKNRKPGDKKTIELKGFGSHIVAGRRKK